jgi:hypothetical protein
MPLACAAGLVCGIGRLRQAGVDCPRFEEPGAKVGTLCAQSGENDYPTPEGLISNRLLAGRRISDSLREATRKSSQVAKNSLDSAANICAGQNIP